MLPPPHLATQASHPVTLPRSAEGNDTATTQDLLEIHSRLYLCLQNTLTPTEELLPSPVVYQAGELSIGCHRVHEPNTLSPVTGAN